MQHSHEVMRLCVTAYLEDIRQRRAIMRDLEWRIESMRERLEGLTISQGETVSGGQSSDMAEKLARIHDLEDQWASEVAHSAEEVKRAYELCLPCASPRYCIWLHHVEDKTWAEVGRAVGYSESHVKTVLAPRGVAEIYELMPESYRRDSVPNAAVW